MGLTQWAVGKNSKKTFFILTIILWYQVKSKKLSSGSAEQNLSSTPKGHHKPLGAHQASEGHVKELWFMPNASTFYHQHVLKSQAVVFKGAAKISSGYKLWTDKYLSFQQKYFSAANTEIQYKYATNYEEEVGSNKYGDIKINADYGKKENRERPADVMTLAEFLKIYNTTDRYLVDALPNALWQEFSLLKCILCGGFTQRLIDSVLWLSSGGTKSFLHIDNIDNINCLISGQKDWFIIDKDNSKNIEIDHGEGEYCGVDVDKVDMFKYPSLQTIPWWTAHLQSGDCIYVPYGWAHQVRSYGRNLAVNIWWTPMTNFNESDCHHVQSNVDGKPLSYFKFTHGEQLRFQIISLLENHGGKITYDGIHNMIVDEHSGKHLVDEESFALLDKNKDGFLEVEEIETQQAEIIEIALQRIHPGNVNIRGMAQKRDPRIAEILNKLETQEPYIEEFLLRLDKTSEEIENFLEKHSKDLHHEIMVYLQDRIQESQIDFNSKHEEL